MGRASKRAQKVRYSAEFDLARLRALLATQKTSSTIIPAWSLPDIFAARDAQMRGHFALAARMAESMRTDDALFVAYGNRLAPARCVDVELVPASDKPKAIQVSSEAEALFGQDGVGIANGAIADVNGCLVNHGVAFGYNVTTPRDDGSRVDFLHSYWPIEFVRWDPFQKVFLARVDASTISPGDLNASLVPGFVGGSEVPIVHGDGRWTIYSNHEIEPFKQEAAIMPASAVWARHAFAIRDWSKGSVAHGNAKFIGEMAEGVALQDENGVTAEAASMMALLRDMANADTPVGIRPAGSKTDFVCNTSTAWQVWAELVGNGEKAAARIYLGTDGTLGSQGGAPGIDVTELFGVAVTKVRGDLGCIQRCFGTGTIEPWAAVNFGDSTLAPTRRYMLPDADKDAFRASTATRSTAFFAHLKSAKELGFVIDQDYVNGVAKLYEMDPPRLAQLGPAIV